MEGREGGGSRGRDGRRRGKREGIAGKEMEGEEGRGKREGIAGEEMEGEKR